MTHVGNLTCLTGPNRGKEYKLIDEINTIGRAEDCTIVLNEHLISRQHAEIHRVGANYQLHDLNSKNGIYLNGERLAPGSTRWLENGGEVSFAFTQFLFSEPSATATATTAVKAQALPLRIDLSAREVFVDGQRLNPALSLKQFELLWFLYQNQNQVVTKDDIAYAIWPECNGNVYDANIDRLVSRVRSRIEPEGGYAPRFITTVRNYGYKLIVGR